VAINEAGKAFIVEARLSVLHFERAVQAARFAAHNSETIISIGRSPHVDPFLVSTLLSIRLPLFPKLRVEMSSRFSCDLVHDVAAGLLDLAIAIEPPLSPLVSAIKIAENPFYIVMSKDHDLAAHEAISLPQLDGKEWVLFERKTHPSLYDSIFRAAHSKGVMPTQIHHVMTAEDAYPFLTQGRSMAFLPKSGALRIARDRITLRPLAEDTLLLKTYITARTDNKSKIASEFMRMFVRRVSQFNAVKQTASPINH